MISASEWNESARLIDSGKIPVGREQSVGGGGNLPFGRIANRARQIPFFKHPWTIEPFWDNEIDLTEFERQKTQRTNGAWCAYVHPGFLNGHPPAIKMRGRYLPAGAQVWGTQYGKNTGRPAPDSLVQVLLTDQPRPFLKITNMLDTRDKVFGGDGSVSGGEVPLFFRAQGAMAPVPLDGLDFLSNIALEGAGADYLFRVLGGEAPTFQMKNKGDGLPEGNRLLFQADVVLQTDRPSVKQQFFTDELGLLRLSGFNIELPQHTEYAARLYSIGIYVPPRRATYWDIVYGAYEEPKIDEIVIGRFYLLSPVLRDNDVPDGTWMPFVRHDVFWNLNYCSIQNIDPFKNDRSLDYFKEIGAVLAGGAAFLFLWTAADQLEATYDTVNTLNNQTTVKGQFWTA